MAKEAKAVDHDIEAVTQEISNVEDLKFRDFERTTEDGNVQRGLKSRHIQLIALGRLHFRDCLYTTPTCNRTADTIV